MRKAYIIDAKRTPVGKARGSLSKTRADDLLVHAIQSVLKAADSSEKLIAVLMILLLAVQCLRGLRV